MAKVWNLHLSMRGNVSDSRQVFEAGGILLKLMRKMSSNFNGTSSSESGFLFSNVPLASNHTDQNPLKQQETSRREPREKHTSDNYKLNITNSVSHDRRG